METNILAIIQGRMGSKRFPGKMMADLGGKPILKLIFDRLKRASEIDKIILATSVMKKNDALEILANEESIECYRGSEDDVLDRFYQITKRKKDFNFIMRICGDNPLIDPLEADKLIKFHSKGGYDYSFNHIPYKNNNYPDGIGAEILSRDKLEHIWEKAEQKHQREHCFDYVWDNLEQFNIGVLEADKSISRPDIKLDIDTREDLIFVSNILNHLDYGQIVSLNTKEIIGLHDGIRR